MSYGGGYGGNDYSTTNYGGGGGFYAGSQGGGTQITPSSEARGRGSNTLRPVTIKQVLEAQQSLPDAPFKIDDVEISHITFIGRIRSVAEQTTNITYVIDDGTGTLEVKQWVDAENIPEGDTRQELNGHVRVLGQLKSFSNKKHVGSHKIRPVEDYNEVQYHLLEAAAVHLHLTRGPPEQFAPAGDGGATTMTTGYGRQTRAGGGDTVMGGMGGSAGARLPEGVSQVARTVYDAIKAHSDSNEGVHVNVVRNKTNLSEEVVSRAVDELLTNGGAYTTVDEYHVAAMDF